MLQSNGISYTEIDIDVNPEMAQEYGVRSLPTSIIVDQEMGVENGVFIGANKLQEIIKGME
jgi:thioredoxin-like negative regulator of GroEL